MPWIEQVETVPIMEARGLIAGAVEEVIAPVVGRLGLDVAAIGLDETRLRPGPGAGRALFPVSSWATATR